MSYLGTTGLITFREKKSNPQKRKAKRDNNGIFLGTINEEVLVSFKVSRSHQDGYVFNTLD